MKMKKEITFQELQTICEEWIEKQDRLELYRDYNDYFEGRTVSEILDYVEKEIEQGNYLDPGSYVYDFICCQDWYDSYEQESFYDAFMQPFIDEHPELEDEEDLYSAMREAMYNCDKFDANIEHFDKEYNFYLLTNPELTYELYDGSYPFIETKHKYLKSLQRSQGWTADSTSMRELLRSGGYNGLGICIMLNCSLFDMINIMKAKKITVKKGSAVYMFNPYIGTGGDTTDLTSDWTFNLKLKEIGFGCDEGKRGPWGYTPEEVYGWVHSYFNKNKVTFKSLRK